MSLIERLRASVECAPWVIAEVERLEAENAALKADAERYRFWRNRYPTTFAPTNMTPEDIDAATDKAIKGEKL